MPPNSGFRFINSQGKHESMLNDHGYSRGTAIDEEKWKQWQILFSGAPKSLQMVTVAMKLKDTCSLEKNCDKPRQHIEKQRHYFTDKGPSSQGYGFSSSHVWM